MRFALLSTALAAAAVLVGFPAAAAAPASPAAVAVKWPWHHCVRKSDGAKIVQLQTADGVRIAGAVLGSGPRGVVLAHESDGTLCNWLPFARKLKAQGFQALAFDFRGTSLSARPKYPKNLNIPADVAAATRELRRRGAKTVVLAGASMGGTAVVAAAASIKPAVSGVVSLSGARTYVRLDAEASARRLQAPALYVAEEDDPGFPDDARALFAATASADKQIQIFPGANHGTEMLGASEVAGAVVQFIRAHSGP